MVAQGERAVTDLRCDRLEQVQLAKEWGSDARWIRDKEYVEFKSDVRRSMVLCCMQEEWTEMMSQKTNSRDVAWSSSSRRRPTEPNRVAQRV